MLLEELKFLLKLVLDVLRIRNRFNRVVQQSELLLKYLILDHVELLALLILEYLILKRIVFAIASMELVLAPAPQILVEI